MTTQVSTRHLPCAPARAYAALADVDQLVRWWGPDGFTSTSQSFDFRAGGTWTMVMHGPDGTDYPNVYRFLALEPPGRAVIEHPDPAHWFELTVTFEPVAGGGTLVTWRQRFDTEEHYARVRELVTAANQQVLARLEAVVAGAL